MIEEIPDDNGNIILDLASVEDVVDHYISLGMNVNEMLYNIGIYVKTYDSTYGTNYLSSFISHYSNYANEITTMVNGNFVIGTDENDTLNGSNTQDVVWAEGGDDIVNAGAGNDIVYGGSGNDTINAGSGDDVVYGNEGDDIIIGDAGNDIIYGGDGDDIITGNTGNDLLNGGNGNDTISGGAGRDTIYGEDGNDTLDGGEDNDILYGENENDSLSGGTGDDTLHGGEGDDTYYINADHGNDVIYDSEGISTLVFGDELSADDYSLHIDINSGISLVNAETGETIAIPDFINLPENYDFIFSGESKVLGGGDSRRVIEGTDEDDVITAGDGFNIIRGGDGNDTITGGDNLNFIYGGDGDDVINGGNGTNIIRGENGDDIIRDGSGDGYLDAGDGNDTIFGGDGNDVIIGGAGADELHGENGDDVLAGNDGDDVLYGEDGNDSLYADAGNDELHGGNGNDSLFGGDGDDVLYGDAGDDYLEAGNGADTLYGGVGNDTFVSGEGINYMYGEEGDDTSADMHNTRMANNDLVIDFGDNTGDRLVIQGFFNFNSNRDFNFVFDDETILGQHDIQAASAPIFGTDGDEWLSIQGNDGGIIHGGAGNDGLSGGSGNDELYGEDGDDTLYGNDGDDLLDGGIGNDQLNGGNGEDTYIFAKGYAQDTINEWSSDHSIVELADINSDEITVSDQWGSNLLISVNGTDDVLTISNFKWGQSTFTFKFADGAEGYVDRDTWQLVLTKQHDEIEDTEQMGAELLESLYEDDSLMSDFFTEDGAGSTVITDVTESTALDGDSDDISDMTNIQAMLLAENMSAFGNDDQVYDSMNITDMTADTSLTDSLLVGSLQ